jgi:hypothetical protein
MDEPRGRVIVFTALGTADRPASGSGAAAGAGTGAGVDTGSIAWSAQTFEASSVGFTSRGDVARGI